MTKRHHLARVLLCAVAIFIAGFHEWIQPHAAHASNYCDYEQQFPQTYAIENTDGSWIVGVTGEARFYCTSNWRVSFQPLYRTPDLAWHVGVTNILDFPLSGHYDAFQLVTFFPPSQPRAFTGYWTPGDGLKAARPVCQWPWRVRERFYNTGNGNQQGTFYSPTVAPTC